MRNSNAFQTSAPEYPKFSIRDRRNFKCFLKVDNSEIVVEFLTKKFKGILNSSARIYEKEKTRNLNHQWMLLANGAILTATHGVHCVISKNRPLS